MRGSSERIAYAHVRLEEAETHLAALRIAPGRSGHVRRLKMAQDEVLYWTERIVALSAPVTFPPFDLSSVVIESWAIVDGETGEKLAEGTLDG